MTSELTSQEYHENDNRFGAASRASGKLSVAIARLGLKGALTLFFVALLAIAGASSRASTVYDCGPGKPYTSLGAIPWMKLGPGDVVNIYWRSTPYFEKVLLCNSGTASQPIRIVGIPGPNGERPIIDGTNATTSPQFPWYFDGTQPRGLFTVSLTKVPGQGYGYKPKYIEINGLETRNACYPNTFTDGKGVVTPYSYNAAGIYIERGEHIVIRNCVMDGNGNGLFVSSNGAVDHTEQMSYDILIEGCAIYGNGNVGRDREHNVYTEACGTVFQYNYFGRPRPGSWGNNLKDRSSGTVIRYNWFEGGGHLMDLVEAQGSLPLALLDPTYYVTHVYGNTLVSDGRDGAYLVHYGGDTLTPDTFRNGTLYFYNNTIVVRCDQTGSGKGGRWRTIVFQLNTTDQTIDVRNNILFNQSQTPGKPATDFLLSDGSGIYNFGVNWVSKGWQVSRADLPWDGTMNGTQNFINNAANDPGFVALAPQASMIDASDFHLAPTSMGIDKAGPLNPAVLPMHDVTKQYVAPLMMDQRPLAGITGDLGAFEAGTFPSAKAFSISGKVSCNSVPVAGAWVCAAGKMALTAVDGSYTIQGVAQGSYNVTAAATRYSFPTSQTVVLSKDTANVNFTDGIYVAPTYCIGGKVLSNGVPVPNATISGSNLNMRTAADGTFLFAGLPAGKYTLTAAASGYSFTAPQTVTIGPDAMNVNFQSTMWISNLTLSTMTIKGGGSLTGTATLNVPASSGAQYLALGISDPAATTVKPYVTIAAGATSGTFAISTTKVTANTLVNFDVSFGGVKKTVTLTITP